jgi:phosphoribosylaminoimidazolecarboxamide formyltransferase/IMP cyclohydrolase
MTDLVPIRRALISVSDKAGALDLARALAARGVVILSTGGTAKLLAASSIPVMQVEDATRFPEMMDGRVKTLHPLIHGGILALRDHPDHQRAMREHRIEPIDLVCVSLYPFQETIARPGCTREDAIENIDVGGPTMIRAAAKNHHHVAVLTDPGQYGELLAELARHDGATTLELRQRLAAAAFERTATYDRAIADYLRDQFGSSLPRLGGTGLRPVSTASTASDTRSPDNQFPSTFTPALALAQSLRYGENPHQAAALYRDVAHPGPSIAAAKQLHGKELSYNNLNDAAAALALAIDLRSATDGNPTGSASPSAASACIIKHANPCGAAVAHGAAAAIQSAFLGDPLAAYGGILACSVPIDAAAAEIICRPGQFLEVVIAPSFDERALTLLRERSANIRLLQVGPLAARDKPTTPPLTFRSIPGGALVQSADASIPATREWQHRAGPAPTPTTLATAAAIWTVVKHLSSNAVAIGGVDASASAEPHPVRLFGAGAGQMDRVTAARLAIEKAGANTKGAIACSDAFFPFADGPELLIAAGITTIIHTGGSKRDQDTFDLCNRHGVTCMTTGVRHFRH